MNLTFLRLKNIDKKGLFFIRHLSIVLLFALMYYISSIYIKNSVNIKNKDKNNKLSFWDCLYFSLVTQTTVGYGDIVMTHNFTRLINFIQLLTIYGVFVITI